MNSPVLAASAERSDRLPFGDGSVEPELARHALERLARLGERLLRVPTVIVTSGADEQRILTRPADADPPWIGDEGVAPLRALFRRVAAERRPTAIADTGAAADERALAEVGVGACIGVPLVGEGDRTRGTLCALDRAPRSWTAAEIESLRELAAAALETMELRTALHAAEARSAEAQKLAHFGSWEWDIATDRVTWSDELFRIYGLEPGSVRITFSEYMERVHPDDRAHVRGMIEAAHRDAASFEFEERIVRPDGAVRVLRSRGDTHVDSTGRVVGLVGVCQDITEELEAEERQRQLALTEAARERLAVMLESITDAFFALDREWRFTYVNTEAERLLMRTREELLGRSIWDEFPQAVGSTFHREYHRAVETYGTVEFVEFYPPLESWFDVRAYPSPDGLSVFFRNINDRKEAERALVESEERFRAVQETSPDGFMVFRSVRDEAGTIRDFEWVYTNPASEAMVGRGADDLVGKRLLEEMPGNRDEGLFDDYVRVVETGERVVRVFHYRHEGLDRWFRNTSVRVGDGFAVAFADITPEKRAEVELQHQTELLRTITDNVTGALFMMDASGRCTFMNPAAEAMIGFSLDEIRDMALHDAIHHHHPDGRPYPISECPIDRALPEEATVDLHHDVFIRRNGEFFPVVCAARPIRRDGVPIGTVVEVRDVTEERAIEEVVRRSEERYRSLIEASAAIVWNAPADGRFGGDQPGWRDFTGQEEAEYSGWGWLDKVHPDDREHTAALWTEALANRTTYEVHHRVCRSDGEFRTMLARAVPILDPDGTIREWVGIHSDVTEAKRLEARQRVLAEAGSVLASSLDYETTLASVARLAVPALADWCAIDVLDDAGAVHRVEVAHTDPAKRELALELERRYPPDPDAPAGVPNVLRTGEPELVREIPEELLIAGAHDDEHLRIIRELGLKSYIVVPLIARDRTLGALTFVSAESGRRYDEADLETAREMALRAAFAVDNSRLFAELQTVLRDLRSSEQNYRFLADSMPQLVWTTTPDGYHDYYNERWHEFTGMPREGSQGWSWKNFLHPDDFDRAMEVWTECLRTGKPYQIEYRFRRASDGAYRWFLGRALPLRDEEGRTLRWFGTCTDIQEQKEAERERDRLIAQLDRERERLQEIFLQAPAAIQVTQGAEHRIISVNRLYEQLLGGRPLIGRTTREALPELEGQGFFELLDSVYTSGEPFVGRETRAEFDRSGNGVLDEGYFNFVYQPLKDATGSVYGIMTHAVEVTDQVYARQQVEQKARELTELAAALERSNKELDQFAYVTSHDLKAPLRGIANLAQWIEEDLPGGVPAEVGEHLELLKGRVHRMEGLIDGILQYSRAGRVRGETEAVDVGALIRDVVELLDPPEGIRVKIGDGLPTLVTERLALQQVFLNLVGNAVKYMGRADGEVRIEGQNFNSHCEFRVSDDGPGIAPEYHERIFGIFQTLEARDKVEGTGIGLSLVKKIVENRGGRVWVVSEEGTGATFHFTWPT